MILHRDRQDIITEILECVLGSQGITKTRIIYKVQLSFSQFKEYVPYLQRHELITYDTKRRVYKITVKGMKILELYKRINELVPLRGIEDIKH